jgi:hypothetical protein
VIAHRSTTVTLFGSLGLRRVGSQVIWRCVNEACSGSRSFGLFCNRYAQAFIWLSFMTIFRFINASLSKLLVDGCLA